jgi:RHS repeat-associated protein
VCVIVNNQASNTTSLTVQTGPAITAVSPRWGPVATPVTLTGANFGASPGTVNWDGAAVSYTQWADDHVTLTVPSGAISGHLTIVRNGVSSNGVAFEVGDESREYYHTDGIGSLRMVTGYDGDVVERHDYLPFGEEWPPRPDQAHIGFGGKEKDQETGSGSWAALNYFGARSLQNAAGRFASADPVVNTKKNTVNPQRWNRYAYSLNNPLTVVDPDGREPVKNQLGSAAQAAKAIAAAKVTKLSPELMEPNNNPFRGTPEKGGPGATARYVPLGNDEFVDMQHFLAAAALARDQRAGVIGANIVGFGVEVYQFFRADNPGAKMSSFSSEDLFSNYLGSMFALTYDPTKPLADQVEEFLNSKGALTVEQFKKDFPYVFMGLPTNEDDALKKYLEREYHIK